MRIAIVNPDKCKPDKCELECKTKCPVVSMGKMCVVVTKKDKIAKISEELCNGCNICTKKCPHNAIQIINLPKSSNSDIIHRYGTNSFQLHRLPLPRLGQVLGIVGSNGVGKSTALKILCNKITPNLGNFDSSPDWNTVLSYFKGSEFQNYFAKLLEGKLKCLIKPQYIDSIPKMLKKSMGVKDMLDRKDERQKLNEVLSMLDLEFLYNENRDIKLLSGGELQRVAIATICVQEADVYIFDEPSSYLDVKQRIKAAACIRSLLGPEKYVICVEHDLSLLDYLSDFVCCIYGNPGSYGFVTMPYNVRDGINNFLEGFIPTENLRFRENSLSFKMLTQIDERNVSKRKYDTEYQATIKQFGNFRLNVEEGSYSNSEITVLLAQNGSGKTTFINHLQTSTQQKVSYKPQIIPNYQGIVKDLILNKIRDSYINTQFFTEVCKPLRIEELLDLECSNLSGGELQRLAILLCLGKNADLYLIDEPSAYLDSEQRIVIAKVIKRFIMHSRKSAFIVEHDFIMATYLADKVICYDGIPSQECTAHSPESLITGMNKFLKQLDVTFRRDPTNWRPRINKYDSVKDREQKISGNYFFNE